MIRFALCQFSLIALTVTSGQAALSAVELDLGHPTIASFFSDDISQVERSIAIDALDTFRIGSAGIRFDPLAGGATDIQLTIRQVDPTGGVGTRGAVLATSTTSIVDGGLAFYDVPLEFTFTEGRRYDVAFSSLSPGGWEQGLNIMEFYSFDSPDNPYPVGGVLEVIDGAAFPELGYPNSVMPHLRMHTIPEPATGLLLAGAGSLFLRRRR